MEDRIKLFIDLIDSDITYTDFCILYKVLNYII